MNQNYETLRIPLLMVALTLLGCPPSQTTEPDGGTLAPGFCEVREDCDPGQVCTAEKYCADCESSGQCRLKEECRADADAGTQRCALRSGWGIDCERNEQCNAGQWCVQGLCRDTESVRLCPAGTDDGCPANMRCNTTNLVCEEDLGCAEDADCGAGEVCNEGSHACVPRCTLETQQDVCLGGERCVNDVCVQCERDADCGVGLVCDAAGKCGAAPRCYQNRDCNVPLVCYVPTGQCVDKPPPCVSDETCGEDQRCDVGVGRCVPRACQPDQFEPNNDRATARPLTPNKKYFELTLCPGDFDYYAFTLARGDRLAINLDADSFSENTFTTVVQDASGRTLASGKLMADYVASASDTYYVGISTTDSYQPYDVNFFTTRGSPCDDDRWEPNDTPATATPLNTAGQVDGAICPQDQDHFSVAVPSGRGVSVSLINYSSSNGLLRLCLFDGATELACSEDTGTPVVSAGQAGGKTLHITVSAVDPRSANTYTAKVEFQ